MPTDGADAGAKPKVSAKQLRESVVANTLICKINNDMPVNKSLFDCPLKIIMENFEFK